MCKLHIRVRWLPGRTAAVWFVLLALLVLSQPADAYVMFDKDGKTGPSLTSLDLKYHDVNAVLLILSNQGPIGLNIRTMAGTGFFPSPIPPITTSMQQGSGSARTTTRTMTVI